VWEAEAKASGDVVTQPPPSVREQLVFPDRVLVRPAAHDISIDRFLDTAAAWSRRKRARAVGGAVGGAVSGAAHGAAAAQNVSAREGAMSSLYVEYLSLAGSSVRGVDRMNGVPVSIARAFPFTSLLFGGGAEDGGGGDDSDRGGDGRGDGPGGSAGLGGAREAERGSFAEADRGQAPSTTSTSEGEMSTLRNMWLGIGPTVGRLHFDPFENLLAVVRGRKAVVLFDPSDNAALSEGHMREATLVHLPDAAEDDASAALAAAGETDESAGQPPPQASVAALLSSRYSRAALSDSTSMVNSPVELKDPAAWGGGSAAQRSAFADRFPLFAQRARPMRCTVHEGETLFIPSWWWHEVASTPPEVHTAVPLAHVSDSDVADAATHVSLNFWWSPAWTKPFPCAACALRLNVDDAAPVEEVSVLLFTVTFYANLAHSLTRSP
jgi:hypothetical protein